MWRICILTIVEFGLQNQKNGRFPGAELQLMTIVDRRCKKVEKVDYFRGTGDETHRREEK